MRVSKECFLHVCNPGIAVLLILSSRKILSFSVIYLTLFSDVLTWDRCCFSRRPGFYPASWRQRFPDARLKIHLRFNFVWILCALLVIFHGRLWRFATQIIEVFFLFAQWWTVIHNPRYVKIHKGRSEIFNDGTCTGSWFWIYSRKFSLMTTVKHFVNNCPNLNCLPLFLLHRSPLEVRVQLLDGVLVENVFSQSTSAASEEFSTLEIALANIHWDVLVLLNVADVHRCSKSGLSLTFCFCVPPLWPPFIPFPLSLCIWNQHCLGWKIFCLCFSVSRACVSERQTIRNSRFPKFADQNHIRSSYSFVQIHTWEYLVLSDLEVTCEEFCLTDTLCREMRQRVLAFTFKKN